MPASSKADRPLPKSRIITFLSLAVLGAAADLITKQAVFAWRGLPGTRDVWWVIDGYVGIETAVNIGAVFGIGAGRGLVFAGLSILAAIGIVVWLFIFKAARQWWLTIALGCVMGGIIGNLYDRLGLWWQPGYPEPWKSGVRDWILWQAGPQWKWPNFNIADSLLVAGAAMLLWKSFFPDPPEDPATEPPEAATTEPAPADGGSPGTTPPLPRSTRRSIQPLSP